jgi:hypothetical protein
MNTPVSSKFRHDQKDFDQCTICSSYIIIVALVFFKQTNNSEQIVSCSFCGENYSSVGIKSHLMICGNKTDQCPNCRKYIRRAIFAYHYENNCANLEDFDADVDTAGKQLGASATFQPNNSPPSSSGSAAENKKYRTILEVDLATHPEPQNTTPQPSNSGRLSLVLST